MGEPPGARRPGGGAGRTLSYLLLPVLGQQQADLGQLLLEHQLVDHVQLQAGLRVFRKRLPLGVVLVVAGSIPPVFFLSPRRLRVRTRGHHPPALGPRPRRWPGRTPCREFPCTPPLTENSFPFLGRGGVCVCVRKGLVPLCFC